MAQFFECDRCKERLPGVSFTVYKLEVKDYREDVLITKDLCVDCKEALEEFLRPLPTPRPAPFPLGESDVPF